MAAAAATTEGQVFGYSGQMWSGCWRFDQWCDKRSQNETDRGEYHAHKKLYRIGRHFTKLSSDMYIHLDICMAKIAEN